MRRVRQAAVLVAVPAALALVLLAVDVLLAPGAVAADDVRFQGAPYRQRTLWDGVDFLPGRPAARLLGVQDDLAYRRTVWLFTRIDPARVVVAGPQQPQLEALKGKAQLEFTTRSRNEPDGRRRAQLLNVLGVLSGGRFSSFGPEREAGIRTAVDSFRAAVRLDPEHVVAKENLEFALRAVAAAFPGSDPDAGASRGRLSGQGRPGGGY